MWGLQDRIYSFVDYIENMVIILFVCLSRCLRFVRAGIYPKLEKLSRAEGWVSVAYPLWEAEPIPSFLIGRTCPRSIKSD